MLYQHCKICARAGAQEKGPFPDLGSPQKVFFVTTGPEFVGWAGVSLLESRGGKGSPDLRSFLIRSRRLLSLYHVPGTISSVAIHREEDICPQNRWSKARETVKRDLNK